MALTLRDCRTGAAIDSHAEDFRQSYYLQRCLFRVRSTSTAPLLVVTLRIVAIVPRAKRNLVSEALDGSDGLAVSRRVTRGHATRHGPAIPRNHIADRL